MKFLVVGASSFVGRHILAYVRSLGYEALGTESRRRQSGLIPFNLLEQRIGECVRKEYFQTQEPVISIICSAMSQIDECWKERETSYKINVEGTIRLLKDLLELGAKPVFFSSDGVFDGTLGYYSEEDVPSPINEYGRQKVEVEKYLQRMPGSVTFRLSKMVGDDPTELHVLSEWYRAMEEGRPIVCIEGQIYSPTYVNDVAKGVVLSCQKGLSGLYHLANIEFFPREELARQFGLALGRQVEIVCRPQRNFDFLDRRSEKTYLDSTKFVAACGMRFTSMREVFRIFAERLKRASGAEASSVHAESTRVQVSSADATAGGGAPRQIVMNAHELSAEVFVAKDAFAQATKDDVNMLKARAKENPRGRCRLLLHRNVDDALHEMLIVHTKGRYIRPQRNEGFAKTYHVIEGTLACLIFSDEGDVLKYYSLGAHPGQGPFCLRLSETCYQTIIPLTDTVVYMETCRGPFRGTPYAPWAPEEGESPEAWAYYQQLCKIVQPASKGASIPDAEPLAA